MVIEIDHGDNVPVNYIKSRNSRLHQLVTNPNIDYNYKIKIIKLVTDLRKMLDKNKIHS